MALSDIDVPIGPSTQVVEEADDFFTKIEQSCALPPDGSAADATSAVLCVLSQRISRGQAAELAEAIPPPVGALMGPCALHRAERPDVFDRREFLRRVAAHLGVTPEQAEEIARAVFAAVQEIPSARREVDDVESQLPIDLKLLWRLRL
jgi:uncharacterized protein (DUF2267 family)